MLGRVGRVWRIVVLIPLALSAAACADGVPSPSRSADGSLAARIAFVSDRSGNHEIYLMNADGTDVRRLTDDPAFDSAPSWSPDGAAISFPSDRDGNLEIYL